MASTPEQVVCTPTFVFPAAFPVNGFQLWKEDQKDVLTLCNGTAPWTDYRGFDPRLANFHVTAVSQAQQPLQAQIQQQQQQQQTQQQASGSEDTKSGIKNSPKASKQQQAQSDFAARNFLVASAPPAFPGIEAQVQAHVLKLPVVESKQGPPPPPQQQQTQPPQPGGEEGKEGGRAWPCPSCKLPFKHAVELQAHLSDHTKPETPGGSGGQQRTVPCDICGKCFTSGERARVHARSAHGEKPCACEVCGSGFSYRCKLLDHMRTHSGEKPFRCDVCCKTFSQKNHLTRHAMIHTGERPYSCDFCGRGFYRKDKLTRHRRIHTGERVATSQPRRRNNANAAQGQQQFPGKVQGRRASSTIKLEGGSGGPMVDSGPPSFVPPSPSHYRPPQEWQNPPQQTH